MSETTEGNKAKVPFSGVFSTNGNNAHGKILDNFSIVDANFFDLEKNFSVATGYNKMVQFLHLYIELAGIALKNGWSVENIRSSVPNIWRIHRKSSFARHIQDWPKGYPGDYEIVNTIMDRVELCGEDTLSGQIGRYALNSMIAQQHREKINIQANAIKRVCLENKNPKIVSIACGPSRDIEIASCFIKDSNAKVVLIDFDQDALDESRRNLVSIEDNIITEKADIRKIPSIIKDLDNSFGKFDLIYAGGLFDYLPEGIIALILKQIKNFVGNNGKILFTNIAQNNPYKNWIETMGNWKLIERGESEIKNFAMCTDFSVQDVKKDPTGLTWIACLQNQL